MTQTDSLTPDSIRAFREDHANMRERDLADKLGISEAGLVAAYCGESATRIDAHPDKIMGAAQTLGEVMALTRNPSCVNEKVGVYDNYHPGPHAAMILTDDIDLRIFPSHWQHAYMVEKETDAGTRRSLQVFDAAGDAVHKIFLREGSDLAAWDRAKTDLRLDDQAQSLSVSARKPDEPAKADTSKLDILRKEWARLTDTHQFLRLTSKLKMNRLGAYRIAGEPFVRALAPTAVDQMLRQVAASELEIMVFTGNRGCIQIHSGPIETLKSMGPWQNVLDPRFNLHLRLDHIAEVWAVEKPTQRGPAVSIEAFNAEGGLILQVFGLGKEGRDSRPAWGKLVAGLEGLNTEVNA
ncbi:hemin-degrading factor [Lentibacter sp. XHP0401]|jgi:putative hemin transport protein|uniref:hemin-degrading factor n=1 Tax=Lentibacter sp. XHP0401 TaxID=2984334 RepID=UPI0021E78BA0|nr:ChuX/HutX family heme-like substrate-binding protein [Lentibacter sp. XHP0401]MCV2894258.1 hemin-degrading factor [Lentibacter sp. XHP0401]